MTDNGYWIWSNEHRAWWGPGKRGYVGTLAEAGVYHDDTAARIVEDANIAMMHLPWHKRNEVAIAVPQPIEQDAEAALQRRIRDAVAGDPAAKAEVREYLRELIAAGRLPEAMQARVASYLMGGEV